MARRRRDDARGVAAVGGAGRERVLRGLAARRPWQSSAPTGALLHAMRPSQGLLRTAVRHAAASHARLALVALLCGAWWAAMESRVPPTVKAARHVAADAALVGGAGGDEASDAAAGFRAHGVARAAVAREYAKRLEQRGMSELGVLTVGQQLEVWTAHARAAIEDVAPLPKPAAEGRAAANEWLQRRALTALLGSATTGGGEQLAAYAPLLGVFGVPRVAERVLQRRLGFVFSLDVSRRRLERRALVGYFLAEAEVDPAFGRSRLRARCLARFRWPCTSGTARPPRGGGGSHRRRARGATDGPTPTSPRTRSGGYGRRA